MKKKEAGAKASVVTRKHPLALTAEAILTAGMPPGMARLWRVADRIDKGMAIDPTDLAEIAAAFKAIVAGEPPKKALGIEGKQGQGRKPMTGSEADIWIARAFRVEQLRCDEQLTLDVAIDKVLTEEPVSRSSLERWHRRERTRALRMLALFDEATSRQRWFEALQRESEARKKTK